MTARKPDALKLIAGTARPDRSAPGVALPLLDSAPPRPCWLKDSEAVSEWDRLIKVMMANRLLNHGNVSVLAQYCALHGNLARMWRNGRQPVAALIGAHRSLASSLGLLSLAAPEPVRTANRFAQLAQRSRERSWQQTRK